LRARAADTSTARARHQATALRGPGAPPRGLVAADGATRAVSAAQVGTTRADRGARVTSGRARRRSAADPVLTIQPGAAGSGPFAAGLPLSSAGSVAGPSGAGAVAPIGAPAAVAGVRLDVDAGARAAVEAGASATVPFAASLADLTAGGVVRLASAVLADEPGVARRAATAGLPGAAAGGDGLAAPGLAHEARGTEPWVTARLPLRSTSLGDVAHVAVAHEPCAAHATGAAGLARAAALVAARTPRVLAHQIRGAGDAVAARLPLSAAGLLASARAGVAGQPRLAERAPAAGLPLATAVPVIQGVVAASVRGQVLDEAPWTTAAEEQREDGHDQCPARLHVLPPARPREPSRDAASPSQERSLVVEDASMIATEVPRTPLRRPRAWARLEPGGGAGATLSPRRASVPRSSKGSVQCAP